MRAAMHLQIDEAGERLIRRYVANGSHSWPIRVGLTESRSAGGNRTNGWDVKWPPIRAWGMPLPNIGSMDGNTGRSEGATAEKAVPFPCAVLDPNRSFVELRVGEPRPGARSVSR